MVTNKAIEFRTLNYSDKKELTEYMRLYWASPLEYNEYAAPRPLKFIKEWCKKAIKEENPRNTFSGISLSGKKIVGLHILRKIEEWDTIGVHINSLWVHPDFRKRGVARKLKEMGEDWARSIGAAFLNTNVCVQNSRMLKINESIGFRPFKLNLRKRLMSMDKTNKE